MVIYSCRYGVVRYHTSKIVGDKRNGSEGRYDGPIKYRIEDSSRLLFRKISLLFIVLAMRIRQSFIWLLIPKYGVSSPNRIVKLGIWIWPAAAVGDQETVSTDTHGYLP